MFGFYSLLLIICMFNVPQLQVQNQDEQLKPLLFLEGTWHGEGIGPHGAFEFEITVQKRGRWLLSTGNIYLPGTNTLIYVDTWVYGYDKEGLLCDIYDTVGSFRFRGKATQDNVSFEWKQGEYWRRLQLQQKHGKVHARYLTYVEEFPREAVSEGVWLPGKRKSP